MLRVAWRLMCILLCFAGGCCYRAINVRYAELPRPPEPAKEPIVRVRLSSITSSTEVSCPGRLTITAAKKTYAGEQQTIKLLREGNAVVVQIQGKEWGRVSDTVILEAQPPALLRVGDRSYRGRLLAFASREGELVVVNELGMEDYLRGVVPCEIGPIRPETYEAVKAQAVAARSFTLSRLERRKGLGFQLYDTFMRDQEYRGAGRETELGSRAVKETQGEILVYEGRPAEALYHANCGGITARGSQPYLQSLRDTPGHGPGKPYCSQGKYHQWQVELPPAQYETTLARLTGTGGRIRLKAITLEKDNVSGRVTKLRLSTDKGEFRVGGSDFRLALGLRSTLFDLKLASGTMQVRGKGWGHGCGLCQDGAVEMARQGAGYREILAHYYPALKLARSY